MNPPDTFKQAEAIVKLNPLPEDYVEQLDALLKVTPEHWREDFGHFYATAFIQLGEQITQTNG